MLLTDVRVGRVVVEECGEPLVDVLSGADPQVRLDARERNPGDAYRMLRRGVVARLSVAAAVLPPTIGLLVVEGWRHPADQRHRFEAYRQQLSLEDPSLEGVELLSRTAALVSPVEVAPHCTGGAVDLTLVELASGAELDLGGNLNAHRTGDKRSCAFAAPGLSAAASSGRHLLESAMHTAGFVNYPSVQ